MDEATYNKKFPNFRKLVERTVQEPDRPDVLLIHHPAVLGDNYEELVHSLNLLADAELPLLILPKSARGKKNKGAYNG